MVFHIHRTHVDLHQNALADASSSYLLLSNVAHTLYMDRAYVHSLPFCDPQVGWWSQICCHICHKDIPSVIPDQALLKTFPAQAITDFHKRNAQCTLTGFTLGKY